MKTIRYNGKHITVASPKYMGKGSNPHGWLGGPRLRDHAADILQSRRDGMMLKEIGARYGVSKQRIHQLLKELETEKSSQYSSEQT